MKLLGERNWYLPRALEWLPKVGLEGPAPAMAGGAPDGDAEEAGRVRPSRRPATTEAGA
jgi:hypothetical protein